MVKNNDLSINYAICTFKLCLIKKSLYIMLLGFI